jgi:putative tricarboxylic transport membrane protein
MVGLFVNLLRIPYHYLYPCIICLCILGVYSVSNNIVDVWIMLAMGAFGYTLRKFGFDLAPIALGLVLAPMIELSLRQSLTMSGGSYRIFIERPIAAALLAVSAALLVVAMITPRTASRWRKVSGLNGKIEV